MDRGVIATATELFGARHFPSVVVVCSDGLDEEPGHVGLLMLRARANIALRRDLPAQADLRDLIRLDPTCAFAYRLLGELAARRSQHESAAIFFREALRLLPDDPATIDWLAIVDPNYRRPDTAPPPPTLITATVTAVEIEIDVNVAPARRPWGKRALGTEPPADATTAPYPRRSRPVETRGEPPWKTPTPTPTPIALEWPSTTSPDAERRATPWPGASAPPALPQPPRGMVKRAMTPLPVPPRAPAWRRVQLRGTVAEAAGFAEYLIESGVVTRSGLLAAQAYQRSMAVALSTAIVTLGLATRQRMEWAAVSHQAESSNTPMPQREP